MGRVPSTLDRRDIWILFAVAVVAVLFPLAFFDRWIGLLDEGYIHELASEINRGKVLYRDVHVDNPLPLSFYLLAWWFDLVGTSVRSSRFLGLATFAVYAASFYTIARANLPRAYAVGMVVFLFGFRIWAFPHWQVYGYASLAASLVTAAAALMFVAERRQSLPTAIASGVLAGAAILTKQDYGIAVTGGVGLALLLTPLVHRNGWLSPLRLAAGIVIGVLLALLPTLAWFAAQGALGDLYAQTVVQPLRGALGFQAYPRLPDLWPFFQQDPALRAQIGHYFPAILTTLWWPSISTNWVLRETAWWDMGIKLAFWTPIISFAAGSVIWLTKATREYWRGRAPTVTAEHMMLLGFAGGFLIAFPPPRDWVHLAMVFPPQVAVALTLMWEFSRRRPRWFRRGIEGTLGIALLAFLGVSISLMAELREKMSWPIDSARAGVYTDPQNGPLIDQILVFAADRSPASEPLPVYPLQPMLPFLAGRDSAAGFHVIWPVQDADRDQRIITDLESRKPAAVVYSISQYAHLGRFQENASELYDYLVDHYEIERVFAAEANGPVLVGLTRSGGPYSATNLLDVATAYDGVRSARWPFAEVIESEVGTTHTPRPGGLSLRVPTDRPVLEFRFGINPDRWVLLGDGPFHFRLSAETPDGETTTLLSETLDPSSAIDDRLWRSASIDLSGYGESVSLQLQVDATESPADPAGLAGWSGFHWKPAPRPRE